MGRVADFIGIDADITRFDALVPGDEIVLREGWLVAKTGDDMRPQPGEERGAASQLHFKKQALGFVQRGGARQRHRLAKPFTRQVLLVARMPGFVDHAKQRAEQLVFVIARGDTYIFRHAAAERVRAHVEAAAIEIETEQFHGIQAEFTLLFKGKRPLWGDQRFLRLLFGGAGQ